MLSLQAGPLRYVRIPKDKATGRLKNFAFICFRDDVSVAYSIALLDGICLFQRNLKVQSRHLDELRRKGLAPYGAGGIHTLDPSLQLDKDGPPPLDCRQQQQQQHGLLGAAPSLMNSRLAQLPHHLIVLAQQQVHSLIAHQPVPLSDNPLLNAHRPRSADWNGSIRHDRNFSNRGGHNYPPRRAGDGYDRSGPPRSVDNDAMKAAKSRFNQQNEDNSAVLAQTQQRQGRFDYSRLNPPIGGHSGGRHNGDEHHRQHGRYDHGSRHHQRHDGRNDSRHSRNEDDRNLHPSGSVHSRIRHTPYNRSSRY